MELPSCPAGFHVVIHDLEYPPAGLPKRKPKTTRFVGYVEWSSMPAHMECDSYYLSSDRKREAWCLWLDVYLEWDDARHISIWASGPRAGVPAEVAAVHLLLAAWRDQWGLLPKRPWFWVPETGLLNEEHFEAIARALWPQG